MKKDKVITWTALIFLVLVLFFNVFVLNVFKNRYALTAFVTIYFIVVYKLLGIKQNRGNNSVSVLVIILSIILIMVLYIIGIYTGFYKNVLKFGTTVFFTRIIPYTAIIVFSELIRSVFIRRENEKTTFLTTLSLILVDLLLELPLYNSLKLESILALLGEVLLVSISINLMCNYTNKSYGIVPGMCYRFIATLYVFVFPYLPDIYPFFESIIKIAYPYITYLIIDFAFAENNFVLARNKDKTNIVTMVVTILFAVIVVMLVSCKFKYGVIVIASGSMTGSIDKGDVVLFEQYNEQRIREGDVIIFTSDNKRVVHRVTSINQINGQNVYYTKGDVNQHEDDGYRTKEDIVAVVKFRIKDIGWPTIYVNEMFDELNFEN